MFDNYRKSGVRAVFHRIPIELLAEFRSVYPAAYKIRYRGPRFNTPSAKYRSYISKATTCLKEDATHFSVYGY